MPEDTPTTPTAALILPPSVLIDAGLNPAETLFAGHLIALVGLGESITLTNDQLGVVAGRSGVNVSLMLTKLSAQGHLHLQYQYMGRAKGQRRTISLTHRTTDSLTTAFGHDWPRLAHSPRP